MAGSISYLMALPAHIFEIQNIKVDVIANGHYPTPWGKIYLGSPCKIVTKVMVAPFGPSL